MPRLAKKEIHVEKQHLGNEAHEPYLGKEKQELKGCNTKIQFMETLL